ncbi:MAG: hypothetical protein O2846_05360 [Proteobacteria bacterium]|jgi:hypothetical protein|nr:hypothetical protein [Pseudomonadota bacterium]
MKNFVDGLYVKDGRLINDRPDGMTGIAKAAMMKKALERQEKAQMIEEGIMRAKMMEKYMD